MMRTKKERKMEHGHHRRSSQPRKRESWKQNCEKPTTKLISHAPHHSFNSSFSLILTDSSCHQSASIRLRNFSDPSITHPLTHNQRAHQLAFFHTSFILRTNHDSLWTLSTNSTLYTHLLRENYLPLWPKGSEGSKLFVQAILKHEKASWHLGTTIQCATLLHWHTVATCCELPYYIHTYIHIQTYRHTYIIRTAIQLYCRYPNYIYCIRTVVYHVCGWPVCGWLVSWMAG